MDKDINFDKFLDETSGFIDDFRPKFIRYFVNLCISYDKYFSKDVVEQVASLIYDDIFAVDIKIATYQDEIFNDMLEDGVLVGFLINRSMFYILENYLNYFNHKDKCHNNMESMMLCVTRYIAKFEKSIYNIEQLQPVHINFDTSDNFTLVDNTIEVFKKIKDSGDEVTFFNLYKGIPIQHKAKVVEVGIEEVTFETLQTQEIAMLADGKAYILKDDNFDKYIKADIVFSSLSNNRVILNNFTCLLNMPAVSRKFVRVHPDIMAEVSLSTNKELVTSGKLFDLSIDGLGVISEQNNGIYAGANIDINFLLRRANCDEVYNIEVNGKVLNIIEYSSSYRYCIKIVPDTDSKNKIAAYVNAREVEIIDNLQKEIESSM